VSDERRLHLPAELRGIFFDFLWDEPSVWALPTQAEEVPLREVAWHLDLPVWSTVPGQPRFDLRPHTVLLHPERWPGHWRLIHDAQVEYPLEMLENGGRWVLLDGYHRLCRLVLEGAGTVRVRRHPEELRAAIRPRR